MTTATSGEAVSGRRSADDTYLAIRQEILRGERAPGEWLREEDLATSLGVSRTPVREALRRLASEGLVRHERHRGVQVESWSLADLDEIFSLRSVLEPWGCALAATSGLADLDALRDLADRMDGAAAGSSPDLDEITRLNNRFHREILEASGNGRLVQLVATVVAVPIVWRTFSHYTPAAMRRSLAHHHELVDALGAADPAWAESVMRSHVRAARATLAPEEGTDTGPG